MITLTDKPILMIHEFCEEYLKLPLQNYILTFDDGLYTQYLFLDELLKFNTPLIFSISSNIICPEYKTQSKKFIKCVDAHIQSLSYNINENFMKWSQILELSNKKNCFIACHGHIHMNISYLKTLNEKISFIKEDTEKMINCFILNLKYVPDIFCFPYNYDFIIYKEILKHNYKFKHFLGPERIDILEI